MYWLNLDEWEEETAEALWGEGEDDNEERRSKMRAKEDKLRSWKQRNFSKYRNIFKYK